jgi:hypothetical protein
MLSARYKARKESLRREIEEIRAQAAKYQKKVPKLPPIYPKKKSVSFPSEQKMENVRPITPRQRGPSGHDDRKFQETVNRLMMKWIKTHGETFQKQWIASNPRPPYMTVDDYEEQLDQVIDQEAKRYAYMYLEKQKLAQLQDLQLGGGGQNKWIKFVKGVQLQRGCSYKTALIEGSKLWKSHKSH